METLLGVVVAMVLGYAVGRVHERKVASDKKWKKDA